MIARRRINAHPALKVLGPVRDDSNDLMPAATFSGKFDQFAGTRTRPRRSVRDLDLEPAVDGALVFPILHRILDRGRNPWITALAGHMEGKSNYVSQRLGLCRNLRGSSQSRKSDECPRQQNVAKGRRIRNL